MTTLEQSNKLAAQPRKLFPWLARWLVWLHRQEKANNTPFENDQDRENRLATQRANAYLLVERFTR
jgi:hypothetical protein